MAQSKDPRKRLEVLSNELRSVVADDMRLGIRVPLQRLLQNQLDILLTHRLPDFPMNDEPTEAIQHRNQEVECAAQIQVRNVDMPVIMRFSRLFEAFSFLAGARVVTVKQPGILEHALGG